ncbi:MAG TPA: hypothetical protein PLQ78_06775 [Flavipsychrobacter sp.]|jgi:hypothetical protein|nr:hypothetical protein [Flavipsychrobacter sp.]
MPTTNRIKKQRSVYTLKIIDENSMEEVVSVGLTRGRIYTFLSTLFVVSVILTVLILVVTPLKYYIPGYGSNKTHLQAISLKKEIDSLQRLVAYQQDYTDNIKAIINGNFKGVKDTTRLDMKKVNTEDMNSILPNSNEIKKDATATLKKQAKEHGK